MSVNLSNYYNNESILIPFKLWVIPSTKQFRIELPCVTHSTNTEWKFDAIVSSIDVWKPWKEGNPLLYGLSTVAFPPYVKGCQLVNIIQNDKYPYNTLQVVNASFVDPKKTNKDIATRLPVQQIFLYSYSIPNTVLLYFHVELDMYNNNRYDLIIDPRANDKKAQEVTASKYIHLGLYAMTSEMSYWKGTSESICVPAKSMGRNTYMTLRECQQKTYPKIENRRTWVGTNSEPLYKYMKWWTDQREDEKLLSLKYQPYDD